MRGLSAAEAALKGQLEAICLLHSLQLGRGPSWSGVGGTHLCPSPMETTREASLRLTPSTYH